MEKAFEVGDKALGILDKLLGPWFTRRQADANTRAALQEVLTDQVATHMEADPNDPVMMEALMSCHGRFGFKNIARIVQLAVPQLDESARPGLISEDWGANFRDKANTCSDPEMAELWAQLLAAEVNNPGSYSRKTVNVVADLEPSDARLFKALCDFRIIPTVYGIRTSCQGEEERYFTPNLLSSKLVVLDERHSVYRSKGIDFGSLARLEWLGLIRYLASGYGEERRGKIFSGYAHGNGQLFLSYDGVLPLGRAEFVPAGTQLAALCTPMDTPEGFADYITDFWRGKGVQIVHSLRELAEVRS